MSIVVQRKSLTLKLDDKIRSILTFTPITPGFNPNSKYQKPVGKAIQAWRVEDDQYGCSIVRLPFQVGMSLTGKTNDNNEFDRSSFEMNVTLRDSQVTPVSDAISILNSHRTVLLQMRMGLGKTIMSTYIAWKTGLKTVVFVPGLNMCYQWANEIRSKSNAKVWVVGDSTTLYDWDFAICYWSANRLNKIPDKDKVGVIIIDECHLFNHKEGINAILSFSPKFIIACSATPTRSRDGMDRIMRSVIGDYKVDIDDPIKIKIIKLLTNVAATREMGSFGVNWTILSQSLMRNEHRNNQIVHCVKSLLYYGIKTLIICREVEHIKLLHHTVSQFYPQCDYICENKSAYNDSMVLIGIIDKVGTGFDEANACPNWGGDRIRCVIPVISIGNIELTKQCLGRAFRHEFPIVLYPVDKDNNVRKHFNLLDEWEQTGDIIPERFEGDIHKMTEILAKI